VLSLVGEGDDYSCGLVLACNTSDFNDANAAGYALAILVNTGDELVLVKFDCWNCRVVRSDLPGTSTIIASSGYDL
jgi:hypothetical protein